MFSFFFSFFFCVREVSPKLLKTTKKQIKSADMIEVGFEDLLVLFVLKIYIDFQRQIKKYIFLILIQKNNIKT